MGILPGNLAFSFFLSVIPILTLIFYVLTSFNLPLDMVAAMMTKPQFFKSMLKETDLVTDTISEDALKMFKKAFAQNKWAEFV